MRPTSQLGYSRYGADMGRYCEPVEGNIERAKLYRVPIDRGGYDPGGAYWGTGQPLYCLTTCDDDALAFVRASNRADAARQLAARFKFKLARGAK